ncbi:MAG TPA: TIGR03013 family XrtA/PEP-CTERM system glycosyltransferase [Geobacteraceae bacterium]|nr:TIGR03013 family XrtA/PEP-CTERM system glycosyltransferase [Geobacteraceae bacterium]
MVLPLLILITGDILNALLGLLVSIFVRFGEWPSANDFRGLDGISVFAFVFVLISISFLTELYNLEKNWKAREIIAKLPIVFSVSLVILSALFYLMPNIMFGRGVLATALGAFIVSQFFWHLIYKHALYIKKLSHKVMVLGTGALANRIGRLLLEHPDHHHNFAGYFGCPFETVSVSAENIIGVGDGFLETVEKEKPHKIVVSVGERRNGGLPLQDLVKCKFSGIQVIDAPSFYEQVSGKILLENITAGWFVFSTGFRHTLLLRFMKKLFDKVLSSAGLVLALPIILPAALLIKITSPGPILFRQVRVGERDRQFVLYKFRTMRADAEKMTGAVWAQKNDPRVTRIGKFLRKTRIDEIPQLYNVLKGDMSFIGPRPERPEFVEKLKEIIPFYSERHFVKPGVTGWAQVKYPYGASVEDAIEKLRYDLYYIKNMSISLDILIILETIKVIIYGRGGR